MFCFHIFSHQINLNNCLSPNFCPDTYVQTSFLSSVDLKSPHSLIFPKSFGLSICLHWLPPASWSFALSCLHGYILTFSSFPSKHVSVSYWGLLLPQPKDGHSSWPGSQSSVLPLSASSMSVSVFLSNLIYYFLCFIFPNLNLQAHSWLSSDLLNAQLNALPEPHTQYIHTYQSHLPQTLCLILSSLSGLVLSTGPWQPSCLSHAFLDGSGAESLGIAFPQTPLPAFRFF